MTNPVIIGNCKLYLGKCEDILPTLSRFDAIVTDPPYKFNNSGGGKFRKARKASNLIQTTKMSKGFQFDDINWTDAQSVVIFCHNDQIVNIMGSLQGLFHRVTLCSYHKTNPSPMANKHYLADTEFYFHAWQKGAHPIGKTSEKKRYFACARQNHKFNHPTVKPLPLMEKIITNVLGEVILDPYMGTGSTGVACINLDRAFIGIEQDEFHFETAVSKIEAAYSATLQGEPFDSFREIGTIAKEIFVGLEVNHV